MRDPLLAFDQDLEQYINECQQQGGSIILMGDFNADVRKGKIRMVSTKRGLTEVILQRHDMDPPATHECNNNRITIDGMFGSGSINIVTGGYLGFKEAFNSDHCTLWISVEEKVILGFHPPEVTRIKPNCLKLADPRRTNRYLKRIKQMCPPYGFF